MSMFYCNECEKNIDSDYVEMATFEGENVCQECLDNKIMMYKTWQIYIDDYWSPTKYFALIDGYDGAPDSDMDISVSANSIDEIRELINEYFENNNDVI